MAEITKIRSTATAKEWNDWHWQLKNRITDFKTLRKYIELQPEEEAVAKSKSFYFRMAITPYYLSLIDHNNPNDPVRMQCIPRIAESRKDPPTWLIP